MDPLLETECATATRPILAINASAQSPVAAASTTLDKTSELNMGSIETLFGHPCQFI